MTAEHPNSSSTPISDEPSKAFSVVRTALVGLAMGAADIVPGVSGGTVALILGVYQRLLAAISSFDVNWLGFVRRGNVRAALRHADMRFLLSLGSGIGVGVVGLAGVMNHLLTNHRGATYAAFFGLILASGWLVGRLARPTGSGQKISSFLLGTASAAFALWLMSLGRLTPMEGPVYTFCCGAVAISAMILPGISGAYILLMLGKYEEITDILHRLPKLDLTAGDVMTVVVFACGCLFGLLMFSRLLRWLLANYWSPTMSVLCGFMIGSLYRVWPWQSDTTPEVEKFKAKVFEPFWPSASDANVVTYVLIAASAFALVLIVDKIASRYGNPIEDASHEEPIAAS